MPKAPLSISARAEPDLRPGVRHLLFLIVKGCVSIAIVWFLIVNIDYRLLAERLDSSDVLPLAFGFVTGILIMVITALRWWGIHWRIRAPIPFKFSVPATFECYALNLALPGSVGGDVVRAARSRTLCGRLRESIMAVLLDRGGNFAAQIFLCLIALSFLQAASASNDLKLAVYLISVIGLVGAVVVYLSPWLVGNAPIRRFLPVRELMRIGFIFRRIVRLPIAVVEIAFLSFVIQFLNVVMLWVAVFALGYDGISFFTLLVAMAFGMLGSALPISLGGLGVREGAVVWVFLQTGMPIAEAIMIAVVFGALVLSQALPGLLILVFGRLPPIMSR